MDRRSGIVAGTADRSPAGLGSDRDPEGRCSLCGPSTGRRRTSSSHPSGDGAARTGRPRRRAVRPSRRGRRRNPGRAAERAVNSGPRPCHRSRRSAAPARCSARRRRRGARRRHRAMRQRGRAPFGEGSDPTETLRFSDPAGVPPSHLPRRVAPLRRCPCGKAPRRPARAGQLPRGILSSVARHAGGPSR